MNLVFFICCYAVGVASGLIAYSVFRKKIYIGTLLISDDDEGTYLSLELKHPVENFRNEKEVTMQIRNINNDYYGETH